jgi:HK97 family phage major capsid protein
MMLYQIVERDGQFAVYKSDATDHPTGEALGTHGTRAEAESQLDALYANDPDAKKDGDDVTPATDGYCLLLRVDPAPPLLAIQDVIRDRFGGVGEFTKPEELHVTLVYCTSGGPEQATAWMQAGLNEQGDPLPLRVTGFGVFDTPDGHAIHLQIEPSPELVKLQTEQAQKAQAAGFTLSEYSQPAAYTPHITLAYVNDIPFDMGLDLTQSFTVWAKGMDLCAPDHNPIASIALKAAPHPTPPTHIPESAHGTFYEALAETGDEQMATLAAMGHATKQRFIGLKSVSPQGAVVGGWAILFDDGSSPDRKNTYFPEGTDLQLEYYETAPLYWEHGADSRCLWTPIGIRTLTRVYKHGVWIEHRLYAAHPLYQEILQDVKRRRLAYSTDSIEHIVLEGYDPRDNSLNAWPLAAVSLVHDPAELGLGPVVLREVALKSVAEAREVQSDAAKGSPENTSISVPDPIPELAPALGASHMDMSNLATFLGLPADATLEQITPALESFIAEVQAMEAVPAELLDALGMDASASKEDVIAKLQALITPEPAEVSAEMAAPAARNWTALKSHAAIAKKSMDNVTTMPFQTRQKPAERSISTVNFNKLGEPGVADIFADQYNMANGHHSRVKYLSRKSMSAQDGASGGYVTNHEVSDTILDPLRAEAILFKLGARQEDLDGVQSKTVPGMASAPQAYWPGEGQAVTESQAGYRTVTLWPKPLAVLVKRPFNFFQNITPSAENQLRKEIRRSLQLEIDRAGFLGVASATASSGNTGQQLRGLLNFGGVTNTPLATDGRAPTLEDLTGAEYRLDAANIRPPDEGKRGWAFNSRTKNSFTSMADLEGQPIFRESWGDRAGRSLLGYPFEYSNQIPINVTQGANADASYIFYGDWEYCVVGMTTTVELVLGERYANELMQGLLAYVYVDIQFEYAEAFQIISGVRA